MTSATAQIPALTPTQGKLLYDGYQHQLRGNYEDAARLYRRILKSVPDQADVIHLLAMVRARQARSQEAEELYRQALDRKPDDAKIWYNFALMVGALQRPEEAAEAMEKALRLDPNFTDGPAFLNSFLRGICDWRYFDALSATVERNARTPQSAIAPFLTLWFDDPELQLLAARRAVERLAVAHNPVFRHDPSERAEGPIRIAYMSGDFQEHPITQLLTQLLETHDRTLFEVTAISFGHDEGSDARRRVLAAVDRFVDCEALSHAQVAAQIKALGIDILVDLNGHAGVGRLEVLAQRPAPIQVTYLGYAGTTGAPFIDYIIADPVVLPTSDEVFFTENIVHLPDCYLPCDSTLAAGETPSRTACGLPEEGLVFCTFNAPHKIDPHVFAIWMRLLKEVPGSVLWMRVEPERARTLTLPKAAEDNGVDPARLIFAPTVPMSEHLARLKHADLFLDTFPYNAHTTATDALRAGVPIVTRSGHTLASRAAASLLQQAALPELITTSAEDYEALALALAKTPERLATVKARLAEVLPTMPLLDAPRYRAHMESAYATMMDRWMSGLAPLPFTVMPKPQ